MTKTLFVLFFSTAVLAQTPAESIVAKAKTIETLTTHFEQIKTIASLSEPAISKGKMYFVSPNKICWEQSVPSSFLMVFEGENVKIKIGENEMQNFSTSSNRILKELNAIIIGGVTGELFSNSKSYEISFSEVDRKVKAQLIPQNKQMRKFISSIKMVFSADWLAEQIVLTERNGNITTINFKALKINTSISDSFFNFK
ncbi:MAG: LolA family protein [Bacteroidales bacterium]